MGKRCNRSSRSVIGPDATIDIHQLVVPIEICMIQTYPETVTDFNLMQLKERIVNGPDVLFGAKVVDALNGQKIDLAMIDEKKRKQIQLRPGMVVHRHLQKGDLVGFNRQPSLHKESMMGHEIIPMPGKTFRFHLAGKFYISFPMSLHSFAPSHLPKHIFFKNGVVQILRFDIVLHTLSFILILPTFVFFR